jgi:hypothetical protein
MAHSALNSQQNRLANRSLYFLLGLLSTGQHLEAHLLREAANAPATESAEDVNVDYLYFCLGLLAFSRQLQSRLEAERDLVSSHAERTPENRSHIPSGALY